MGENLVLNMESKGFQVSVYNRSDRKVVDFLAGRAKGKSIIGTHSMEELVGSLSRPRKVMLMIKAGSAVDDMIETLIPLLEPGDIIIDGGNTHFPDTNRRTALVESKGLSTCTLLASRRLRYWRCLLSLLETLHLSRVGGSLYLLRKPSKPQFTSTLAPPWLEEPCWSCGIPLVSHRL